MTACYYADLRLRHGRARRHRPSGPPRSAPTTTSRSSFAGGTLEPRTSRRASTSSPSATPGRHYRCARTTTTASPNRSASRTTPRHGVHRRASWPGAPSPALRPLVESVRGAVRRTAIRPTRGTTSIEPDDRAQRHRERRRSTCAASTIATGSPRTPPPSRCSGVCDYAQIGCAKVSRGLRPGVAAQPGADTYLEVRFERRTDPGRRHAPGRSRCASTRPTTRTFDESNDYSCGTNTPSSRTRRITAYLDGTAGLGDAAVTERPRRPDRERTAALAAPEREAVGARRSCCCWSRLPGRRQLDARRVQRSSANPENVVSAGSMTQDNSADNTAIMGATDMVPGRAGRAARPRSRTSGTPAATSP